MSRDPGTIFRVITVNGSDRDLLQEAVVAAGLRIIVIPCHSVGEALAFIHLDHEIDLVICDLDAPSGDGVQLLTAIREDPDLRSIPVALMCAGSEAPNPERAGGNPGVPCFTKAVTRDGCVRLAQEIQLALQTTDEHAPPTRVGQVLANRMRAASR